MYMLLMFSCYLKTPAPRRGEIVRQIGQALRDNLENLGKLVSDNNYMPYLELCINILLYPSHLDQINGKFACRIILSQEERKRITIQKQKLTVTTKSSCPIYNYCSQSCPKYLNSDQCQ